MNTTTKILLGFAGGVLSSMAFNSKKGKDLRENLNSNLHELKQAGKEVFSEEIDGIEKGAESVKARFVEMMNDVKNEAVELAKKEIVISENLN